ncbi:hypothetical protein F8M41_006451 [Gigaspora margarita]|uniref:Uncharacterized protein n=1 Tax=Gigaspora margarita TaxID=4874 RepID=A0A8H3X6I2_GIGMA|nr:hypothetical protein F8M41_006451 [Gigaspora margarita]
MAKVEITNDGTKTMKSEITIYDGTETMKSEITIYDSTEMINSSQEYKTKEKNKKQKRNKPTISTKITKNKSPESPYSINDKPK